MSENIDELKLFIFSGFMLVIHQAKRYQAQYPVHHIHHLELSIGHLLFVTTVTIIHVLYVALDKKTVIATNTVQGLL